jgi:ferredoxin
MAYVITNKCTCCGACKDSCPVEAISEGAPKFVIDADTCVDCGACTGACPNDAIEPGA